MATYEKHFVGDFDSVLNRVHNGLMNSSMSISHEGSSDFVQDAVRCAVRVYERYSVIGSNRVSMHVTLLGIGNGLFLSAITAGGSQAIFFKVNTLGEESFLECLKRLVEGFD